MQSLNARFIPYASRGGAENMAIDEYLVSLHGRTGMAAFRVYGWSPPAISLGRYQGIDCLDLDACRADSVAVVRRITGGGAIYHGRELTYSLVLGNDDLDGKPRDVPDSFNKMNRFLILFYRWLGFQASYSCDSGGNDRAAARPDFCYSGNERFDILIGGKKIGGNAQRRLGKTVLQHGSIPFVINRDRVARYFKGGMAGGGFTTLTELAGRDLDAGAKARLLAESFAEVTGLRLKQEDIGPGEKAEIESIMNTRYLDRQWTREGRMDDNEGEKTAMA
ncbi:MAG: lipoate--protein ligase family protein [Spirochaetes bacterium]|nr:lipoate--protein ligase family protein [Spirochaetota bacterium]